eukprot:TRINITY_DN35568_c0_g1_i1.p1 TRINITY_DN35568_c0_g1~~TRINITY_DN35568_c0_g1_i1.p1  ORF type:complete len:272 (-),score=34.98 TRINITY_DN35568_c0_g1_i1:565-1380(-)
MAPTPRPPTQVRAPGPPYPTWLIVLFSAIAVCLISPKFLSLAKGLLEFSKLSQTKMAADLFYTPSSCGAASYIAAKKAGLIGRQVTPYEVDIRAHKVLSSTKKGEDFYAINVKGNVPALVLEDKTLLNEGAAVLQWIADQSPEAALAPPNGTPSRYLLQAKLNYVASELHASCGPLFNPSLTPEVREAYLNRYKQKLAFLSTKEITEGKKYLVGDSFTVVDSYLYIVLTWLPHLGLSMDDYPTLKAYVENIASLDFVKAAHAEMAAAKTAA